VQYVKEWQSYFKVHQLVEGKVISINTQTDQVEMSFKKKEAKGKGKKAKLSLSDFTEGQVVVASVKKVETFGMFLAIEDSDVSGLCHRSEVSETGALD
jgi:rRNA biogenesis protein RRP5